jgi:hypothetical protein
MKMTKIMRGLGFQRASERQFGRLDRGWENISDNVLQTTNEAPDTTQLSGRILTAQLSSEMLRQNVEDGIKLINWLNCSLPYYITEKMDLTRKRATVQLLQIRIDGPRD